MLDGSRTGGQTHKKSLFFNTDIAMPDEGDTPMNRGNEEIPDFEGNSKNAAGSGSESVSAASDHSPDRQRGKDNDSEGTLLKFETLIKGGKSECTQAEAAELLKKESDVISQIQKIKNYDLKDEILVLKDLLERFQVVKSKLEHDFKESEATALLKELEEASDAEQLEGGESESDGHIISNHVSTV